MLFFPAPRSYTGEDVVELHGHGGRVVSDAVARARVYVLGARARRARRVHAARVPQRQARSAAGGSRSRTWSRAARAQRRARRCARSTASSRRRVDELQTGAHELARADRGVARLSGRGAAVRRGADARAAELDALRREARRRSRPRARTARVLRDGLSVAIAGPPNAGKSSLLNRLAGYDAAIVTDIPGHDARSAARAPRRSTACPSRIVDTAGLRDSDRSRRARRRAPRAARGRAAPIACSGSPMCASRSTATLAAARAARSARTRAFTLVAQQDRSRRRPRGSRRARAG